MIRLMNIKDKNDVIEMMTTFYNSPAVLSNGSPIIYENDFNACIDEQNPYLEGYVFVEDELVIGYAMIAKSFSTEFGKPCIWIEDIYLKEEYRHNGLATSFFKMLQEKYPNVVHRLEAERENENAIKAYNKNGFEELPYLQLIRNKE